MKPEVFRKTYFDESAQPDLRTIRSWVRSGELPGEIINGNAFIDADEWERQCQARRTLLSDFRDSDSNG
jgi:hypothetical protein